MPADSTFTYLPLTFGQLVDLVKQLPENEKRMLVDLLEEDIPVDIPEAQQQIVIERVQKYKLHPELLIDEETALNRINKM